jgi:hypothetical protein
MVQIRTAAEQLAAEGSKRTDSAQQVEEQVTRLERTLAEYGIANGMPSAAANGKLSAV